MIIWIAIAAGGLILGVVLGLVLPRLKLTKGKKKLTNEDLKASYDELVKEDVYHIFDQDFHKELTEKAKAVFQDVIAQNTVALTAQLETTTKAIQEHLDTEISGKLQTAFGAYTQAVSQAQQDALTTIKAAVDASVAQQAQFSSQLEQSIETRKSEIMTGFQQNMAEIVSHYVLQAIGEQASIKEQLPAILREMEAQQEAMQKDMRL